jgi:hypothetical protein
MRRVWAWLKSHFKVKDYSVSFEEQMEWAVDIEALLKHFALTPEQRVGISHKTMLFKRGLRHGTVFFIDHDFPSTLLPEWYWHQVRARQPDNSRAKEAREEREAFFYLVNELKDLKERYLYA